MKFTLPAIVALVSVGAADKLTTFTRCIDWCHSDGVYEPDAGGRYGIDANDGCRDWPGPPGLYRMCIDWNEKRMNANYEDGKHCLRKLEDYDCYGNDGSYSVCADWREVTCDW